MQATAANSSVTFQESDKVQESFSLYKVSPLEDLVRFIVKDDSNQTDEFVVRFRTEATTEFDPTFDALQRWQTTLKASSTCTGGTAMDINNLPYNKKNVVNILLENLTQGNYSIGISEYSLEEEGYEVLFYDSLTNIEIPLSELNDYAFSVNNETELLARFILITREVKSDDPVAGINTLHLTQNINIYPNPTTNKTLYIEYHNLADDVLTVQLTDVLGKTVLEKEFLGISTSGNIELHLNDYQDGVYLLIMTQGEIVTTEKIVIQ
jgi:hypothetical protein